MDTTVRLTDGITFESLNPHNFHLKNDYISNILSTAFMTIPLIDPEVRDLRVTECFVSMSYAHAQHKEIDKVMSKHTKGLAIEFTWDNFTIDNAFYVADVLFDNIDENILIRIYVDKNKLYVGRGFKNKEIEEVTGDVVRLIKRKEI